MNVDTGELVRINEAAVRGGPMSEEAQEFLKKQFTPVPKELEGYANEELGDKDRVIVDMSKATPLTRWAHAERDNKKKKKNKLAKASRKANR